MDILAEKNHHIGETRKECAREVLRSVAAAFFRAFVHAAETESALDLLAQIDGDQIQDGAEMKAYAFVAELRKMEVAREQNGPELLHDFQAAAARREFHFACICALRME